jgi:hypothetical protein
MSDVSRAGGAVVLAVNGRMPRRRESGLFLDMLRWCNLDLQRDLGRASLPPEGGWEMVRMLNMIGRAILEKAKDQRLAFVAWNSRPRTWASARKPLARRGRGACQWTWRSPSSSISWPIESHRLRPWQSVPVTIHGWPIVQGSGAPSGSTELGTFFIPLLCKRDSASRVMQGLALPPFYAVSHKGLAQSARA